MAFYGAAEAAPFQNNDLIRASFLGRGKHGKATIEAQVHNSF
jgi:hypothetical protein